MVPRIGIVKHLHVDALDRIGSLHGGHIDEPIADFLEGDIDDLAPVAPSAAHRIREIIVRIGDRLGSRRGGPRVMQARPQGQTQPHEAYHPDMDPNPLHCGSPPRFSLAPDDRHRSITPEEQQGPNQRPDRLSGRPASAGGAHMRRRLFALQACLAALIR